MRSIAAKAPPLATVRTDLLAGLVVGIIAFPLSIALAVAVGVPPIAGLYTAVIAGAVAAVFGGSNFNITGPTAALVPVLSHAVLAHGPKALPTLGLLAGLMLVVLSILRAGRLVRYIPGTVVIGFTAGIALSIAFGQLNNLFNITGTDASLEHFHERTWDSIRHISSMRLDAPAFAVPMLVLLFAWKRVPRLSAVPGPLVAVVLGIALDGAFHLDIPTVSTLYGDVPRDMPTPSLAFFEFELAVELLPLAFSVAVLAGIESLLSAVVADGMAATGERHESDRELRGQGLGNIASVVFGGVPSTAAIARTAAGIRAGGSTRLVGITHAFVVLTATVLLGTLAGRIPMAVLAAILVYVAWNIAEAPEVWRLVTRAPRGDAFVVIATALITLTFDLTYAIAFGVLASMWMLLRQLVRIPAAQEMLPDDNGSIRQVSPELSALMRQRPDIAFFNAEGLLSFYSAAAFEYELTGHSGNPLILRMKDVHHIDGTGLLTLEGIIDHRRNNHGRIILTAIQPELFPVLERFGILRLLGPENIFEHTRDAIAAIDAPGGREPHAEPLLAAAGA
jgi:SulP family sulfate permease